MFVCIVYIYIYTDIHICIQQIDRANSRMLAQLSSSEGNLRELKELRSQYHELKGKEELQGTDATTLQTRVLDLEEQLADAL